MLRTSNTGYGSAESKTMVKELSEDAVGRIWLGVVTGVLVILWCILDSWNHSMNGQLADVLTMPQAPTAITGYVLTLAFILFGFVAAVYFALFAVHCISTGDNCRDIIQQTMPDGRWTMLVVTHTLSSVLLQSLMMPTQMMSLGLFAATRAVETPTAAAVRSKIFNERFGGHSRSTIGLLFIAAWTIFYAYTQIAECLCVWSGFGVAITGPALYFVYALLLTVPAANAVYQEATMVQLQINPLFMLGVQNLGACALLLPILAVSHLCGIEDVKIALVVLSSHSEIVMMVLWLGIQMVAISGITAALIYTTDSFWAVAARGLRAIFWWYKELAYFYFASNSYLSIARPNASVWSFVMLCGVAMGVAALVADIKELDVQRKKDGLSYP
jgi:hypothetical protein